MTSEKLFFISQICILFQGTKGVQETKGELERKLSYYFVFFSNYEKLVVNTAEVYTLYGSVIFIFELEIID